MPTNGQSKLPKELAMTKPLPRCFKCNEEVPPERVKEHIQYLEAARDKVRKHFKMASMKAIPTKKTAKKP